jgi:hypothetical protein
MPSDGKSSHCLWQGELKIYGPSQTYKDNHFAKKKKKTALELPIWMKNKNFQILEIGTFWPHLINFILETVKVRGSSPTYCRKLPTQSIQQQ